MCQSSLIFLLTHPHTSSLLSQDYFLSRGTKGSTLCHVRGKPFSIATLLSARKGEAEEHWARSQDLILASHQLAVRCRSHPLTSLGLAAHTLLISWGGLPIKWENRKKNPPAQEKEQLKGWIFRDQSQALGEDLAYRRCSINAHYVESTL